MNTATKEGLIHPISSLSDDVLLEIFLLFPASEVVKFMPVCRSWYNLITSPHFTETHHRRWNHHEQIVLIPLAFEETVMYQSIDNSTAGLNLDKLLHDFARPSWLPYRNHDKEFLFYYEILDSCDGLLLIHMASCHREDPESGLKKALLVCNPKKTCYYIVLSLVYDSSIKRYKVLWARAMEEGCDIECYLIDVDPDEHQATPWRKLGLLPMQTSSTVEETVSYEGKIHWLISAEQDSGDLTLITLDVATEKFKIIACPSLPFDPQDVCPIYTGSKGKFYHLRSLVELHETEVWEFELWYLKCNDHPNWFKHRFTVSPPPTSSPYIDFINFIGELEEGKRFVFECRETFVVYETTSGRCTNNFPQDSYIDFHSVLPSIIHVNSLLSYAREY
ncbi:hypothetical protein SAY87_023323 [Trapa incisa]|uniref:F-box domain-containing protein n=1 Tax=Trapa incisa TaxID=236973 RepID=A0AAN7KA63_9MYRT|nr:hypothetical protein SAY87_023323 [Trapa incisa]